MHKNVEFGRRRVLYTYNTSIKDKHISPSTSVSKASCRANCTKNDHEHASKAHRVREREGERKNERSQKTNAILCALYFRYEAETII